VVVRALCIVALVAACAGAQHREGTSRFALGAARAAPVTPLHAAVADATLVAEPAQGEPWQAFLGADGSARRMDGAEGRWQVDADGRLCTSFADRRNCWWMVRDGGSEPVFRGESPGERARLAQASPEL
jgi:hypothetical protein